MVHIVAAWEVGDVAATRVLLSPRWVRHHIAVQLVIEWPVDDRVQVEEGSRSGALLRNLAARGWASNLLTLPAAVGQQHRVAFLVGGHGVLGDGLGCGRRPRARGV